MDADLKALEQRLSQLVDACQRLRADNNRLRQDLAASVSENHRLGDKIALATTRLEEVLAQIPETE